MIPLLTLCLVFGTTHAVGFGAKQGALSTLEALSKKYAGVKQLMSSSGQLPLQHVWFTTFGTRDNRNNNTVRDEAWLHQLARPTELTAVHFLDPDRDGIRQNKFGLPVLSSMYGEAFRREPDASSYMYFNGDLLFNLSAICTLNAIVRAAQQGAISERFLAVGRRTNVHISPGETLSSSVLSTRFDELQKKNPVLVQFVPVRINTRLPRNKQRGVLFGDKRRPLSEAAYTFLL
jgi:hypothetical protein